MTHKKRDKRSIQSCQWIYEALKELMAEKDYSKITVIDIVNRANIGRTTFYRNFNTIDDVLKMKCVEEFEAFRLYCMTYAHQSTESECTFLKPFLNFWCEHCEIVELLMKAEREKFLTECLTKEVTYFLNQSSINKEAVIYEHLNYFIAIRVSNCMSLLTEWIKTNKSLAPDALATIITTQLSESLEYRFNK